MSNAAGKDPQIEHASITEAQRNCLSHILRNSASALGNVIALVENRENSLSTYDLSACLRGVNQSLTSMLQQLDAGSFCTLSKSQCRFVSKFVGCAIPPDIA
jgi:hypothetical protein